MEVSGENLDSFLEEAKEKGMHVIDNNKVCITHHTYTTFLFSKFNVYNPFRLFVLLL